MNPFIDFATAVGKSVGNLVFKQGVATPEPRPVAPPASSFSFDLSGGVQKLLQPVSNLFQPKAGGSTAVEAVNSLAGTAFDALNRNVGSAIDRLFGQADKRNSAADVSVSNQPYAPGGVNTYPSQTGFSLSDAFTIFKGVQASTPVANVTASSPAGNMNTTLLIGGGIALVAVALLATRRA